ncbi:MAG: hxcR [Gammaproteobacteria bacterium]|jgi:type IV pilus assembly protein PilB|nr:hxcR [Gammaproteobacteria bacterium]
MLSYLTNKIFIASQWLDELLNFSLTHKISDLHIEPLDNHYRIRLRLDGLLQEALTLSKEQALPIISRIKILSHMDIAEQRLPQDGRLQYEKFSHADFRISTCPTVLGEKCVIRNLMTMLTPLAIDELGMLAFQKALFTTAIQKPQGLILVTGPTGSGKTVTLYSALQSINQAQKNIISIEDPVEIKLAGINQINIQPKIGLTFASTLRTTLRQDPDVIMVGEMRDKETAEIAIAAAQTGHLVLSTLHTNSAVDSFTRLQQMGIENYQIASACRLIIAQRLVRKRCKTCQDSCPACHEGYRGRTAIYEMIEVDQIIQRLILQAQSSDLISSHLKNQAWISMQDHAAQMIATGITTTAEAKRVLGN